MENSIYIVYSKQLEGFIALLFEQERKVGQSTVRQETEFRAQLSHSFSVSFPRFSVNHLTYSTLHHISLHRI